MYSLGMRRFFCASHYLIGGDWGEENSEHSHNYQLEVILEKRALDQHGFLVDIVELERHLDEVTAAFHERTLNTLPEFTETNPSIENLASILHESFRRRFESFQLKTLIVTIWEDDIAWTSYRETL